MILDTLAVSDNYEIQVPDVNLPTGEVEEEVEGAPPDDAPVRVLGAGHAAVLTAPLPGPS